MHLVPVFTLEMHTYKCLPKFIQTHNSSSGITTANIILCHFNSVALHDLSKFLCVQLHRVSFRVSFPCIIRKKMQPHIFDMNLSQFIVRFRAHFYKTWSLKLIVREKTWHNGKKISQGPLILFLPDQFILIIINEPSLTNILQPNIYRTHAESYHTSIYSNIVNVS